MEVSNKRKGKGRGSVVVAAGSVWESRMKSDEVRGEIKVLNAEEERVENGGGGGGNGNARLKRSSIGVAASGGKRKTWKSDSSEGLDKNPIQVGRGKPEKNSEENCNKKGPIHTRKVGASADKFDRSMIQSRKVRSEKGVAEVCKEGGESGERNSRELLKSKSDSGTVSADNDSGQMRRSKSDSDRVSDESRDVSDGSDGTRCEMVEDENKKNDCDESDENCKDFEVCQEKVISSSSNNVNFVDDEADEGDDEEEEAEEEMDEEVKIDVKEINIPESNSKVEKEPENEKIVVDEPEKKVVVSETEKKKVVINEPEKKKKIVNESEPKKVVSAHMRFHHRNERPVSVPLAVKQSSPIRRHSTIYQNFSKANSIPKAEEYHSFPQSQNKLQSLVDLIMWRDISRSAFIFGFGTFVIVSSSYAKDINLSVISVMSYIGLVYLAVIFLYRSLICRGVIDVEDSNYVLGEEEAIWVLKLVLPYLNELLSKLKALFSGDPGTTIKLAVLLFVLARCGSSITIWKMAKFGFVGVFIVPKICSSYSAQLTAYANFWIRRFRDAWDSCSHKKAVALGIFGLVWNMSSVVARIWAVFVLFVAFRYYQQHYLVRDECVPDEAECDETCATNFVDINREKKGF